MKSLFLFLLIGFPVTESFCQNLNNLKWLIGDWEMIEESSSTTESWELLNDSTFIGSGITKQGNEIVFREDLRLESRNDLVTYVAVLPNKTTYFKLAELSTNSASFEDPKNDFPSKIIYELKDAKMNITLIGFKKGEEQNIKMSLDRK